MLCSNCSRSVPPVVAIDIDGTLGNYHLHFIEFASAYLGQEIEPWYTGMAGFREWMCARTGITAAAWHDIKLAYRQGAQKRSMPVYEWAPQLVQGLRNGADVWLTTTRPYMRLDNIDPDTRAWLDRAGIGYDGLLYDEDKYERLADIIDGDRVVAVLDDLPEQYDAAARVFGPEVPILRHNGFNSAVSRPTHMPNLQLAQAEIYKRITRWKEQHDEG